MVKLLYQLDDKLRNRGVVMETGPIILILSLSVITGIGLVLIYQSMPYIQDQIHEKRIAYRSYLSNEAQAWFTFKLETMDIFSAFNPINISIHTGSVLLNVREIQLTFEGASTFFMGDYDFLDPDFNITELHKAMRSNVVNLERSMTTFVGRIENLTYTSGGDFDVGITLTYHEGYVSGYGMGDTNYALKGAIRISPPEAFIQLRNSRITMGLTYVASGLACIAIGLSGIYNIFTKLVIG